MLQMNPLIVWLLRHFPSLLRLSKPQVKIWKSGVHKQNPMVSLITVLCLSLSHESPNSSVPQIPISSSSHKDILRHVRHVFLKSRHDLSVAFPLPTRLPTLSRKEMKLVVDILFLSKPTFSDSTVICPKRNNWVFIQKKKKVHTKPNFEQMKGHFSYIFYTFTNQLRKYDTQLGSPIVPPP